MTMVLKNLLSAYKKYSGYKLPSAFCDDAFCLNNIITPTVKVYIRLHLTTINPSNVFSGSLHRQYKSNYPISHLLDTFYIAADSNAFGKYSDNRDGFAFMFREDLRKE